MQILASLLEGQYSILPAKFSPIATFSKGSTHHSPSPTPSLLFCPSIHASLPKISHFSLKFSPYEGVLTPAMLSKRRTNHTPSPTPFLLFCPKREFPYVPLVPSKVQSSHHPDPCQAEQTGHTSHSLTCSFPFALSPAATPFT